MRHLTLALALVAAAPLPALAQQSAEDGEVVARRWCASCHLVAEGQLVAQTDAPSFASIAEGSAGDFAWLAAFLADPHPAMPRLSLSRQELRDLGAYLDSLRPEPAETEQPATEEPAAEQPPTE